MTNPLIADRYIRLKEIVGAPNSNPPIPPIVPVSKSTIWDWVQKKQFPQPFKLSARVTVWSLREVQEFLNKRGE